jgi:hypothetical protein
MVIYENRKTAHNQMTDHFPILTKSKNKRAFLFISHQRFSESGLNGERHLAADFGTSRERDL